MPTTATVLLPASIRLLPSMSTDAKNKESLFEAEMHRSRNYLKILKELDENDFSFIVMDEIFSSTNPEEGISGAYAIAEKLASFENSISSDLIDTDLFHLASKLLIKIFPLSN